MISKIYEQVKFVSLLEQLSVNLGNFIFFILAARLAGPKEFGLFAILLVIAQLILSIAVQWILLPITSKSQKSSDAKIFLEITRKVIILLFISPFLIWFYAFFISSNLISFYQFILTFILSMVMIAADITRYFLVRVRAIYILLISNLIKWLLGFLFLLNLTLLPFDKHTSILIIFLGTLFFGLFIQSIFLVYFIRRNRLDENIYYEEKSDNFLLGLGLANVYNTISFTILFSKVNIIAFGAFQAFRSLVNIFPFFLQFVETHFSASLVKQRKSKFIKSNWIINYLIIVLLCMIPLNFLSEDIVSFIFGPEFSGQHTILFWLFLIISVQSLSRLLSVQYRLQENYKIFRFSAYILFITGSVMFILINMFELLNYYHLIAILLITSILQLLSFIIPFFRKEKSL